MLKELVGLTAAAAVLAGAVAAHALTLTNRDVTEHSLKITEGNDERVVMIQPEETLSDLCSGGCTIALGEGEATEFNGTESLVIEGGNMSAVQ